MRRSAPLLLSVLVLASCSDDPAPAPTPDTSVGDRGSVTDSQPVDTATTDGAYLFKHDGSKPDSAVPTWTLHGEVLVSTKCATGTPPFAVYVGLYSKCGDWTKLLELQTMSQTEGAKLTYVFNLTDGKYHLMAMMDCNGNANAKLPIPDKGDVVFHIKSTRTGEQPCRSYDLNGKGSLDAAVELNTTVE